MIEEIAAADPDTVWRHSEAGPLTLRATPLAHQTLGISDAPETAEPTPNLKHQRSGTKQEVLIAMLRAEGGTTIKEIVVALEWRLHTVRGAMSGALKKRLGLTIISEKVDGRGRCYRIVA